MVQCNVRYYKGVIMPDVRQKTSRDFIIKSRLIHGDKFNYDYVDYKGARVKVKIVCPDHGLFEQLPSSHYQSPHGCPKCAKEAMAQGKVMSYEQFVERANEAHGGYYLYTEVTRKSYTKLTNKVMVKCPDHGYYEVRGDHHANGSLCMSCSKQCHDYPSFLSAAKEIHGDRYDYSQFVYTDKSTASTIICKEHGPFEQVPDSHLRKRSGCSLCIGGSKGESYIIETLKRMGISFVREKRFIDCRDKQPLPFDFQILDFTALIEYHGQHHYHVGGWYDKERLADRQRKDQIKEQWAIDNGYTLLVIHYQDYEFIPQILAQLEHRTTIDGKVLHTR